MSELDKLLEGVEVEWKTLGEIGEFIRGKRFVKTDITSAGIPCIHYGEMYTHYGIWADKSKSFISVELASKLRAATKDDVVFVAAGETIEDIGRGTAWLGNENVVIHDACFFYKSSLNSKYVAYFSRTKFFHDQIKSSISSGKISAINAKGFEKVIIPIPSLEIQKKIVGILDTFTGLTAELTAELTTRKKQYAYYREQLLSFEEGEVEWKTLGEVAEYSKKRVSSSLIDKSNYIGVDNLLQNRAGKIDSNYVPTEGNLTGYGRGDILIGNIRPYLKKIWYSDRTGGTNGDVLVINTTTRMLNPKYLYQVLANDRFFEYNMQHAKGAKMPRGNKDKILEYRFPIPSPEEQARIVSILDKFETLTTSISEGLPREIELRKKQYEYYLNKLLTFPKENIMV